MRTAKEIIEEYRARGYGMESLRVLADSRDEPLRSEMLALLSNEGEGRAAAADDMVFFLVSEDEEIAEVGGDIIDFDILASDADALANDPSFLAAADESVAELAIGDDEGTAFVHLDAEGHETVLSQPPRSGHMDQVAGDAVNAQNEMPAPEEANAPETQAADQRDQVAGSPAMAEECAGGTENTGITDSSVHADETPDQNSDYLPGSAGGAEEVDALTEAAAVEDAGETPARRGEEPLAVLEETGNVVLDLFAAEMLHDDDAPERETQGNGLLQPFDHDLLAVAFPMTAGSPTKTESSSERRRRRRDERKRAKAEKKLRSKAKRAAEKPENHLPEIVLSPMDGTETLSEESCRQVALSSPTFDFAVDGEGGGSCDSPDDAHLDMRIAEMRAESILADAPTAIEPAETPDASLSPGIPDAFDASVSFDENADVEGEDAEANDERNVIRLYDAPGDEERAVWASGLTEDDAGRFSGNLLLLENTGEAGESETVEDSTHGLSPMARIGLLRALTGGEPPVCEFEDMTEGVLDLGGDHIIVQPGAEIAAEPEMDQALIAEMEKEYQSRLNEFAKRLLELQTTVAEGETRFNEKTRALGEKEKEAADLSSSLRSSEETIRGLTADLAGLSDELTRKREEANALHGLKDEHTRLYREFEDLRGAYNEVVTNVMPSLQNERDELVETVERQGEDEDALRRALKASGRRMAVGYSLAAAAAVMMVALPLTHWLGVGGPEQRLVLGNQKASELSERLGKAEMRNVEAEKIIFDLQQQSNLAKLELEKLGKANHELSLLSDKRTREVAQLKANFSGGGSTRTVLEAGGNLGMNGPIGRDGTLRVNEVRDPGGSIEMVLAENRERFAREDAAAEMARSRTPGANMQVSAVALRSPGPAAGRAQEVRKAKPAAGQTAVVKKGEGVAQVVYRILGTRDPQVIAWVIKENNLKKDKRGNPKIFPEQKLVLPSTGERSLNQASAAKR